MRAILMHEPGGPEVLRLEEVETPTPNADEVFIEVSVAGVNFADTGMRRGMFHGPGEGGGLPATPGFEVVGTVVALGEGVSEPVEGTRVPAVLASGGYAECTVAAAEAVVPVPDGVGPVSAYFHRQRSPLNAVRYIDNQYPFSKSRNIGESQQAATTRVVDDPSLSLWPRSNLCPFEYSTRSFR